MIVSLIIEFLTMCLNCQAVISITVSLPEGQTLSMIEWHVLSIRIWYTTCIFPDRKTHNQSLPVRKNASVLIFM